MRKMAVYTVTVKTKQPKTRILEHTDTTLKVALHAPPQDGKANDELIIFLSKHFGKSVKILTGKTSKKKLVKIE